MIEPVLKDEALVADIQSADPGDGFAVWWLGQSGFLIKAAQGGLLLDPYLSDSLTAKYAETDKPHIRMTAIPVAPERLVGIDVITSSHNHTDHLDAETILPLRTANPDLQMVAPAANLRFIADRLGCAETWPVGLSDGQQAEVGGFRFHGIAAAHDQLDRDDAGRCCYLGFVVQFGRHCIYHSGDTLWHDQLVEQLSPFDIDVAFLPINGRLPRRRVAGNLWGQEAAELALAVKAKVVIPCHYDMFTFNTETPAAFVEKCDQIGQAYQVVACGQRQMFV